MNIELATRVNKVLCIEDNVLLQYIYRKMLEEIGFAREVVIVSDGREAIQYCRSLKESGTEGFPELIILDLNLPLMGGWDFLDELERNFAGDLAGTNIVIVSSSLETLDRERAINHSRILDYYKKPVSQELLLSLKMRLN